MSAEQFADALATVTGIWPEVVDDMVRVDGRGQGGQLAAARAAVANENARGRTPQLHLDAQWVWSHANAAHDPGGRILVRKVIKLDKLPRMAQLVGTCDNEVVLYVNGKKVGQTDVWTKPVSADVTKLLKVGDNIIAAEATNWPDLKNKKGVDVTGANPAGFIAWVGGFDNGRQSWGIGTDATWLWSEDAPTDWKTKGDTKGWKHVAELPGAEAIYGGQVNLAESRRPGGPDGGRHTRSARRSPSTTRSCRRWAGPVASRSSPAATRSPPRSRPSN